MTLGLCGNQSLDELQRLAVKHFSDVEDKQLPLRDFSEDEMFKGRTGAWVKIVPAKDLKILKLLWPNLPRNMEFYKTKPLMYVSHVLGHEGKNSLLSELIRKDLAVSCDSSPCYYLQDQFSGFQLTISLTKKGEENLNDVVRLCFAKINCINKEGYLRYVWDELATLKLLDFDNRARSPAMGVAKALSLQLGKWRPDIDNSVIEDLIRRTFMQTDWDEDVIASFARLLTPQACLFIYTSKVNAGIDDLTVEHHYKTQCKHEPVPDAVLQEWTSAAPEDGELLGHPHKNEFMPELPLTKFKKELAED